MKTTGSFRFSDFAAIPTCRHPLALLAVLMWLGATLQPASAAVEWRQDFEGDTSAWTIEGGVWAVGLPSGTGAPAPFGGTKVAATTLTGNYPSTSDARLISPEFLVPAASEAPRLAYHYWYQIGVNDHAQLQIRPAGGAWQDIAGGRLTETAGAGGWARHSVDLRAFEGQTVQVGFRLVSAFNNSAGDHALGWYVDDVGVETGTMVANEPEGFEAGFGDWSVEGGVWQRGVSSGAGAAPTFAGANVVGTILSGNYGRTHEARLITPEFVVPAAGETPRFSFHYWYQVGANDHGQLQIRTVGGAWQDVVGGRLVETAGLGGWARQSVDLRVFAGQTVQLAFRLVTAFTNVGGDFARGWYLDEAGLQTGPMLFASPEGFETGFGDWSVEGGVWQQGVPTGAGAPSVFTGSSVVGTILSGNYGANLDARLITPEFTVPATGEAPRFTYHYWYQIGGQDYAQLQIRTVGGAWQDITGERLVDATAGAWSRRSVDLRAFAGQNVQLAFRLVTVFENRAGDFALGWYLDEAGIETGPMQLAAPEGFENGFGDWSAEGGLWQVGSPSGAGAPAPFAGTSVAGTIIAGTYGGVHDARLVTPEFTVPAAVQQPRFSFYHWFNLGTLDFAQLQVRVVGGAWQDVAGERLTQTGLVWIRRSVDLRAYAGQNVQLGFRLVTDYENRANDIQLGWYIDEAQLETGPMQFATPEGFENGFGDWSSEGGVWQLGAPTAVGSPAAYEGASVAGTILAGNYPLLANARLISPEFVVPPASRAPQLSFQHWRLLQNNDTGRVEVSVGGGTWSPLSPVVAGSAASWQRMALDLTPYGGQPVRVAWRFSSDNSFVQLGWHVDDVQLGTLDPLVLTPGVNANGTLPAAGARALYVVEIPPGGHLRFTLDDLDNLGANEVYVRRGALPTAGAYDYRFTTTGADQSLFVPDADAGLWFVLLVGAGVPNGGSAYQLRADLSQGIALTAVSPSFAANNSPVSLSLTGAGFDSSVQVELRNGANTIAAASTSLISRSRLRADFVLNSPPPGVYQVVATHGSDSASLPLQVIEGSPGRLDARLIIPWRIGRHVPTPLFVEYANVGDAPMMAPLLVTRVTDRVLLTQSMAQLARGLRSIPPPSRFGDSIQVLGSGEVPGILNPGERKRVQVMSAGLLKPWDFGDVQVQFSLGTVLPANPVAIPWNSIRDEMRPATIPPAAWNAIWENFKASVGTTWGDYARRLADSAGYLGELGLNVTDVADLLTFELLQSDGLAPYTVLTSSTDSSVRAPGLALVFARTFSSRVGGRHLRGPLGYGWSHNWEYRLQTDADGNRYVIGPGGLQREFQADVIGGGRHFSVPGDPGVLSSLGAGRYQLREINGTILVFRSDGLLDFVQDLNGNRITAGYSGSLLTTLTHSNGQSFTLAYAGTLLQTVTDPVGRIITYGYDGGQHLASVTYPGSKVLQYSYVTGQGAPREHALASITYPGGAHRYFAYDQRGRLNSDTREGGGGAVTFAYNDHGGVTVTDANQHAATYLFDHRGLLAKASNPAQATTSYEANDSYRLTTVRGPDGGATRFEYDSSGNVRRVLDPLGRAVQFTRGANARITRATDALNRATTFGSDANGNLAAITHPDGSRQIHVFDPHGDAVQIQDRRGQTTTLVRDVAGRLTRKELAGGRTFDYGYDTHGNLTTVIDSLQGTTTLAYDARDQIIGLTYPDGRGFTYTYDGDGRRLSRTTLDGNQVNYVYDLGGRLIRLETGPGQTIVEYLYDSASRLVRENKGNGTWTEYEYDATDRVVHLINHNPDNSVRSRFDYSYDATGRRKSMGTLAGTHNFSYNAVSQLTGATRPDGFHTEYAYDAVGNRTSVNADGTLTAYTSNLLNAYTQVGAVALSYDAAGNVTGRTDAGGTTTYAYDAENRLTQVVSPAAGQWDFEYDAFGNRTMESHNGQVVRYLVDPIGMGDVVAEYDDGGALLARYHQGWGLVSREGAGGNRSYYNFDGTGNTRELTAPDGAVANAYDYDPFGQSLAQLETIPNPYTYVGRYGAAQSAGGLVHMRQRFYSPEWGRFISPDELWNAGRTLNTYTYAENAPIDVIDPLGLWGVTVRSPFEILNLTGGYDPATGNWYFGGSVGAGESLTYQRDKQTGQVAWSVSPFIGGLSYSDANPTEGLSWSATAVWGIGATETHQYVGNGQWKETRDFQVGEGFGASVQYVAKFNPGKMIGSAWSWTKNTVTRISWKIQELNNNGLQFSLTASSRDPNELIPPAGYGAANFLPGDRTFAYALNFENEPTATAPAQVVQIVNALPPELDLSTFELAGVGFGEVAIPIPAGSQRFEHTETITREGTTFDVVIEAWLDVASRELHATFSSVMPDTGLPPTVDVGFLPPEDDTGRGLGYVAYLARPVAALSTGTEIRNVGLVTFDPLGGGDTFRTDLSDPHNPASPPSLDRQALVTIDADGPTSAVTALPNELAGPSFIVAWSGSDAGAGIATFDVYVQTDGGAWVLWLDDTTGSSAEWLGEHERSYGFYSVATDGVGFGETSPGPGTVAQTTTTTLPRTNFFRVISTGQAVNLEFVGTPGEQWLVQRAPFVNGPWDDLGPITIQPGGSAPFTDSNPLPGQAFYQAIKQ